MPFTLTMPKLSPTMEEGTIAKWHKKVGDKVEAGDVLIEVATDKATVEYEAIDGGYLRKILIPENEEAQVNQAIAIFTEDKAESIEGYQPEGIKQAKEEAPAPEQKDEKPQVEAKPKPKKEPVGMTQPDFEPEAPLEDYRFEYPVEKTTDRIKSSPLARRLAKEKNLDLSSIKGTGPGGRIMKRDLAKAQPTGAGNFGRRETPTEIPGSYEEIPLNPMRKVIAKRLQQAKSFIPHFYVEDVIDAEPLIQLREQLINLGTKVSYNDLIIRACALALRQHPEINRGFNSANQSIIQFKTIDISVAVTVDGGLITPIIRHADFKTVPEISLEVKQLAKRAKEGKLDSHEYKGGSFTVSNLGMYGIASFQAIINPPQAAILAVSGILDTPVVKNGQVVPGKTMRLNLSLDHRVIDGVAGAIFMNALKKILENPVSLVI